MAFPIRLCPNCQSDRRERLFELPLKNFCGENWTYSRDWEKILDLSQHDQSFPIDRCIACEFVFARYEPSQEFLDDVYDRVISQDLALQASREFPDIARRLRYVGQLIHLMAGVTNPKVLDFGCGFGVTLKLMAAVGLNAFGLDTSKSRSAYLKEQSMQILPSFDSAAEYKPFDIIVCDNVLEHVPNPRESIAQLAGMCRRDGLLYISVPSYEKSRIRKLLEDYRAGNIKDITLNPWEHLNYFSLSHLDSMLKDYGFLPLARCDLAEHVDIGLRPEAQFPKRFKNGLASFRRLMSYILKGTVSDTVEDRFFRFKGQPH